MRCIWCDYSGKEDMTIAVAADPGSKISGQTFYRCPSCGADILDPLPDDSAEDIYEGDYMFRMPCEGLSVDKVLRTIEWELFYGPIYGSDAAWLRSFRARGKKKLLDVGFGAGLRLKAFMEKGFDACGIETSQRCVEYADKVLGCMVKRSRVEDLPEEEKYDFITAYAVLEHIKHPKEFVGSITKRLNPGGFLLFRVPVNDSLQLKMFKGRHSLYREAPRHVWIPSIKAMTDHMDAAGLELVFRKSEPLASAAGHVGLTLFPQGTYSKFFNKGIFKNVHRLLAAAGTVLPGLPVASIDALSGVGAQTDFLYQKVA